jgi:hypothetical protein
MIVNVINPFGSFFSAMLTLAKRNRALTREADIYAPSCSVIRLFHTSFTSFSECATATLAQCGEYNTAPDRPRILHLP